MAKDPRETLLRDATQILDALRRDVGACCVFLVDVLGNTLINSGEYDQALPLDEINVFLGNSVAALVEAGKTLDGDQGDFSLIYQREGKRHHIFGINVGEKFLITMLLPKTAYCPPIGAVVHYSQRAARELQQTLAGKEDLLGGGQLRGFSSEAIEDRLDDLFGFD